MTSAAAPAAPRESRLRRVLRPIERALALVGLVGLIYHGAFHLSVIASGSMSPTLRGESVLNGDIVLSERISYHLRNPRRWEVLLYREEEQQMQVMKRVIGLPGETIAFDQPTQEFIVNGARASRPASLQGIKYLAYGNLANGKQVSCAEGYFVLGDFSMDSQDSRWLGPVNTSQIRARPWLVVWPLSHLRFVNP